MRFLFSLLALFMVPKWAPASLVVVRAGKQVGTGLLYKGKYVLTAASLVQQAHLTGRTIRVERTYSVDSVETQLIQRTAKAVHYKAQDVAVLELDFKINKQATFSTAYDELDTYYIMGSMFGHSFFFTQDEWTPDLDPEPEVRSLGSGVFHGAECFGMFTKYGFVRTSELLDGLHVGDSETRLQ